MTWRLHPSYIQFIWYGEPYSLADWRHKLHSWANSSSFHAHNSYLEACSWFSDMLISPKAQHGFYREFVFWGAGMSALWWCQVESGFNLIWQTAVLCKYHSRDLLCLCGAPVAHPSQNLTVKQPKPHHQTARPIFCWRRGTSLGHKVPENIIFLPIKIFIDL